ncbi:MAG: HAMP domain-containing sensor histidine kinase [Pseudomonadota bacterium]
MREAVGALVTNDRPAFGEALLVTTWLCLAVVGAATTGGWASPIIILFALGPLVAFAGRKVQLGVETTVFALLALIALSLLQAASLLPDARLPTQTAILVATLLGLGVGIAGAASTVFAETDVVTAPERETPRPIEAPATADVFPDHMRIETTPLGLIRTIDGDATVATELTIGGALLKSRLFSDHGVPSDILERRGRLTLSGPDGETISAFIKPNVRGADVSLIRAPKIDDARDNASSALENLHAFYAGLSHDLRSPLNAVINFADMMRQGIRGPLPDAYADYAGIIHDSGRDLLLLVEDILTLAMLRRGEVRIDLEPVDVTALAHTVIQRFESLAVRESVSLEIGETRSVWANADVQAVRRIWENLVANAIKFSPRGSPVTLSVFTRNEDVVLSVADRGPGMSEEDLRRILKPFAQAPNEDGKAGSGLGLATVDQLTEAMDGVIDIDTALGHGTRVRVYLPKARAEDLSEHVEAAE